MSFVRVEPEVVNLEVLSVWRALRRVLEDLDVDDALRLLQYAARLRAERRRAA